REGGDEPLPLVDDAERPLRARIEAILNYGRTAGDECILCVVERFRVGVAKTRAERMRKPLLHGKCEAVIGARGRALKHSEGTELLIRAHCVIDAWRDRATRVHRVLDRAKAGYVKEVPGESAVLGKDRVADDLRRRQVYVAFANQVASTDEEI